LTSINKVRFTVFRCKMMLMMTTTQTGMKFAGSSQVSVVDTVNQYWTRVTLGEYHQCIICMCDLKLHDEVRYLPCLHTYHRTCIDDWLMRSFVCPSCLRPVEVDFIAATANATAVETNDPDNPSVQNSLPENGPEEPAISASPSTQNSKIEPTKHQPVEQGDAPPISPNTLLHQAHLSGPSPETVTDR
uniref:RING-type domain-containing protein n=1 Tax=Echinostoma caproni TaxID=27848 RepID=A0A183B1F7_9TREM